MVLKSLELQGFKSFPDKTKVDFDRGLTAVVGPNGSGKSNISDAVRWVMGEMSTKSLRGERMEDVIFSGTKTRKAVSFACVSLTVDNKARELAIDSDEVTITRKLYRAGESEYLINGAQVRLRDVNEIFMDTGLGKDGYSIIGQGKIAQIVESKNNDRRDIFEEAAGISKFRYRKNESERKLCQAEDNLIRLRDILAELEARIAPLKEQSQKATKFLELAAQKKTLELSIWMNTLDKANISIKEQDDNLLIMQNRQEAISDEIQTIEDNIAATYEKMQKCLVDAEQKREQKEETDEQVSQFNSQIAVFENDILHNKSNIERAQNDIDGFSFNHQNSEEEIEKKQEQISLLTCELEKTKS
ncbi:MAG: AAA family ATPase, partial [Oscillospiraceae bacterium]